MTGSPTGRPDDDLEEQLRDLGPHLDLGVGATAEGRTGLVAAVLERLEGAEPEIVAPSTGSGTAGMRQAPRWLVAAVVGLVLLVGLVAVTPARDAVAGWLGIGAVEIRTSPVVPTSSPTSAGGIDDEMPSAPVDLDALGRDLPFALRVPDPAQVGEPLAAVVDPAVPSGLVAIRYEGIILVQMASRSDGTPVVSKHLGPGTEVRPVPVDGADGLWITGDPHEVVYTQPDGKLATDPVRLVGDVLVWEDGNVTYRLEGARSLEAALAIATSLH